MLRSQLTVYVAERKKLVNDKIKTCSVELHQAYNGFLSTPTNSNINSWQSAKQNDVWLERRDAMYQSQQETRLFRYRKKTGTLFAKFSKGPYAPTHVKSLIDQNGVIHHSEPKIIKILQNFYMHDSPISDYMINTYIKVLPKPGKVLTWAGSYHPVSLINLDLKLISKILVDRWASPKAYLDQPSGFLQS